MNNIAEQISPLTQTLSGAQPIDVMVVGAGPAGSSMAAALATPGRRVVLVEKDRFPRHKVCGEFLSPEAQDSLRSLDLFDTLYAQQPVPLYRAELFSSQGRRLAVDLPGQAWGISRYTLDHVLAQAAVARGAQLWEKTAVTGWQIDEDGFVVRLHERNAGNGAGAHAATHHASLQSDALAPHARTNRHTTAKVRALVMACGRHSRAGLPPRSPSREHDRERRNRHVGVKMHYNGLNIQQQVELYLFADGYAGINPVENGCANVCLLVTYEAFATAGGTPDAIIRAAANQNAALARRLEQAQPLPETSCVVAPVDIQRPAAAWDGLPVLGDAAAMIAPLCGDGMAMALHSAELCVPLVDSYLQGEMDWPALGQHYTRLWRDEFQNRLRLARWLEQFLRRPTLADLLLQTGALVPPLASFLVNATRGQPR